MTTTALQAAPMGVDDFPGGCEPFEVFYSDELGSTSTTVLATGHDDAADQVAFDGSNVATTRRLRDGDEADHTITVLWTIRPAAAALAA